MWKYSNMLSTYKWVCLSYDTHISNIFVVITPHIFPWRISSTSFILQFILIFKFYYKLYVDLELEGSLEKILIKHLILLEKKQKQKTKDKTKPLSWVVSEQKSSKVIRAPTLSSDELLLFLIASLRYNENHQK